VARQPSYQTEDKVGSLVGWFCEHQAVRKYKAPAFVSESLRMAASRQGSGAEEMAEQ
jgi:hypothetical protein